jgi:hypothetical protein
VVTFTSRPFYPSGKEPPLPIGYEAGCPSGPAWMLWTRKNSFICRETNLESLVVQLVALHTTWKARHLITMYKILFFLKLSEKLVLKARVSTQEY